jgi:molybdopterin-guanine dinucleotide biosynthesis protein A
VRPRQAAGVPASRPADFDAVMLAGGRAARMDGADKPALEVGGLPMMIRVAAAVAAAGAGRLIVVGPARGGAVGPALAAVAAGLPGGLVTVRESPPGAGPVAALRRGLSEVRAPWLALLAADLPFLTGSWLRAVHAIAASSGRPGAVPVDDGGRQQWLASVWRAEPLRSALDVYTGGSLGGLLGPMEPARVAAGQAQEGSTPGLVPRGAPGGRPPELAPPWFDCDDPAELAAARARFKDGDT